MDDEQRWAAVVARDQTTDGTFVYGVLTTGVFCRPSCPSRQALRRNVDFFDTAADAEKTGLRACRRCHPTGLGPAELRSELVARACRVIDEAPEPPTLDELARALAVSRFHLHRLFKAETGITPKAYAAARRAERLRGGLGAGVSITAAAYDAGFGSSSRLHDATPGRLGMTATEYREGGPDMTIRFAVAGSSLGAVLVAATDRGICAIELGDDPDQLVRSFQDRFHAAELVGDDVDFHDLVAKVVGLVEDPSSAPSLPLDVQGTAFQERVWRALRQVPVGSTVTYSQLATHIGAPTAARAVASACAANRLAVAVPCHRVIRTDGSLSGYRWGVERKAALLAREAIVEPTERVSSGVGTGVPDGSYGTLPR